MTFTCAIAPLDQATTGLGWLPGNYTRLACGLSGCGWQDRSLQFLADPGTPVLAPMPVRIVGLSPLKIRPAVEVSSSWSRTVSSLSTNSDVTIRGITPAPGLVVGTQLDKGGLLGRVAAGERGVRWSMDFLAILDFFRELGLEPVGAGYPPPPSGLIRTAMFGGKLLARSTGPAGGSCVPAGALHGYLSFYGLGSAAPAGYVDPQSSVYARYGVSTQTDTTVPEPHENVSPAAAGAGVGAGLLVLGLFGAWWLSRR